MVMQPTMLGLCISGFGDVTVSSPKVASSRSSNMKVIGNKKVKNNALASPALPKFIELRHEQNVGFPEMSGQALAAGVVKPRSRNRRLAPGRSHSLCFKAFRCFVSEITVDKDSLR